MNDYSNLNNYNEYQNNGYMSSATAENELALSAFVTKVMQQVYVRMFLGLVVTAVASWLMIQSPNAMYWFATNSWAFWVLLIAEIGLVIYLSARINKMSSTTAAALFFVYSALNGVVLSPIFLVYTGASIAKTFFITAGVFGVMSVYGWVTKKDLSKMGSILMMCLLGLIVVSVVNIFMKSTQLDWIISFAGVAIFIGLTAWDTQAIKQMAAQSDYSNVSKVATMGALNLYLDFINLFLYLLRIFGNRD